MTAAEYAGWLAHLARCPPGDFFVQFLLARLICSFENFLGRNVRPHDVAPWLPRNAPTPAEREADRAAREEALVARAQEVAAIYERRRNGDGVAASEGAG